MHVIVLVSVFRGLNARQRRVIPRFADRLDERVDPGDIGLINNAGGPRHQVDAGVGDAFSIAKGLFNVGLAGSAAHALDVEGHSLRGIVLCLGAHCCSGCAGYPAFASAATSGPGSSA